MRFPLLCVGHESLKHICVPPEWQIIDTSLHAYGKIGVSLYDTLGKDAVGMLSVALHIIHDFDFLRRIYV